MTEQLLIQLDTWLFRQIQQAADCQGQTVTDWCVDLFEAAFDPCEEPVSLVERVYRLEQIVASMGSTPSSTAKQSNHWLLTERQQTALSLVERRWRDGSGETTAADLIGDAAGCDLDGPNAGRLARKVLSALAHKQLVQLRKVGTGLSARPLTTHLN